MGPSDLNSSVFPERSQLCWRRGEAEWVNREITGQAEEQPRAKSGRGEQTGGAPLALKLTRVLSQDSRVGWWPQGASAQLTKQCQWLSLHLSPLVVAMLQQTGVLQPPAFSPHLCLEQLLGNSCLPPGLCRDTLLFLIHFSQPAGKF